MYIKIIKSQPMRLVITILLAIFLNQYIPLTLKELFLALSLSLKEILIFMLPFLIFSSVYNAFAKIRGHAVMFTSLLLTCVILSNFFSVNLAGVFSYSFVFNGASNLHSPKETNELLALWEFGLPKLVSNNIVLLISLVLAYINKPIITKNVGMAAKICQKIVDKFLKKFFIPLLPLFVFGFMLKLLTEDILSDVIAVNPKAFIYMITLLIFYLSFLLLLCRVLYKKKPLDILRNIVAPTLTAFSSMSSAAALPFSIAAAEKNTGNKSIA
ncbi:MAG: cation:dicarboxylase symporter family transporter, partial [Pseudomonadota bacterium]